MKKLLPILGLSIIIFACAKKESKEASSTETASEVVSENCTYTYNDSTTTFGWKAYKTNEKIGVGGTFDNIMVTSKSASSIVEVLKSISFEISTKSVNSDNEDRDGKLVDFFFKKMTNTDKITGIVKSIEGTDKVGTTNFEVTMNGVTGNVTMTYNTTDGILNFSGVTNMEDFNGQDAVKSLNKKCEGLHTGADGVSMLWPQVSLTIATQLAKVCN